MATPMPPPPPSGPTPPLKTAQQHPAQGTPPTGENTLGKVYNRTASAPAGAPSNPAKPDVADLFEYLDSVAPEEIRGESVKLLEELKQAQASHDYVRATQAKDALEGLKDKANKAGMGASELPELAQHSVGTLQQILGALGGAIGGRKPGAKPPAGKPKAEPPKGAGGSGGGYSLGTSGPCIVGTYEGIRKRCGKGQQAHHIIPDTLARTGNRAQGAKGVGRVPGMASFGGGPSICLQGNAKTEGTEHNTAHQCDDEICAAAQRTDNGPVGTIPVSEAVPIAMKSAIAARPECKEQIEAQVRKAYPEFEKDNRSMNGAGKPAQGDAKAHLESGGTASDNNRMPHSGGRKKR